MKKKVFSVAYSSVRIKFYIFYIRFFENVVFLFILSEINTCPESRNFYDEKLKLPFGRISCAPLPVYRESGTKESSFFASFNSLLILSKLKVPP